MNIANNLNPENNFGNEWNFSNLADSLLAVLPERSVEIVKKRFGLTGKKPETLEKIGVEQGITRERVRQILFDAIKKLSGAENKSIIEKAEIRIVLAIEKNNGIIKESELIKKLGCDDVKEANAIVFFIASSDKIKLFEEKGLIKKSLFLDADVIAKVKEVESIALDIFQNEKTPLKSKELVEKIFLKKENFSKEQIENYLDVLDRIKKNQFEKWGLSEWDEISPKGTREKLYLILKEKGQPMHFTQLAKLIDEYGLSKKKAHPQTVHNELIKDSNFVLIGRGIYALKEWGYKKGTIKDVIEEILKKSKKTLSGEEILKQVLRVRRVKKTTVMINLNDTRFFTRDNNHYSIKK